MSYQYQPRGGPRTGQRTNSGRRPTLVFTRSKFIHPSTQEQEAGANPKRGSVAENADSVASMNPRSRRISTDVSYPEEVDSNAYRNAIYQESGDVHPSSRGRKYPQQFYNTQTRGRSSENAISLVDIVVPNKTQANDSFMSTSCNASTECNGVVKVETDITAERKCDSEPNVWKKRAEFFREAVPKDSAEEEKMLNDALVMSSERFEEEQLFRSLLSKLDSQESTNEAAPRSETPVAISANISISHSLEFPTFPTSSPSGDEGTTGNISNIPPAELVITPDIGSNTSILVQIPVCAKVQLHTNAAMGKDEISILSPDDRPPMSPDGVTTMLQMLRIENSSFSSPVALNERVLTCDQAEEYLHRKLDPHPMPSSPHDADWQRGFDLSSFSSVDSGFLSDAPRILVDRMSAIEPIQTIETSGLAELNGYSANHDEDETEMNDVTLNKASEIEMPVQQFNENVENYQHQYVEVRSDTGYSPTNEESTSDWKDKDTIIEDCLAVGCCARCECGRTIAQSEEQSAEVHSSNFESTHQGHYVNSSQCHTVPYMGAGSAYPYAYGYPGGMFPAPFMMAQGMGMMIPEMRMITPGMGMMAPEMGMMTPGMGMMPSGIMMPGLMPYTGMMPYGRYPMMPAPGMMMQPIMMMMPDHLSRLPDINSPNVEDQN